MLSTEKIGSSREQDAHEQPSMPPHDEVQNVLLGLWKELLNIEHIGVDDDFFDLGGDSLIGAQLFSTIKKQYGLELGLSVLFDARTIRQLAEHVHESARDHQSRTECSSLLVPLQPRGSRVPLFWIPGGLGSSVLEFKEISILLGEDQPVYGFEVEAPGDDEELEGIRERATRLIEALRSLQAQGPYRLIGFCGGGLVAFEMSQQLSTAGQKIEFLGIVDCADPHYPYNWREKFQFTSERTLWRTRQFFRRGPIGCVQQLVHRFNLLGNALLSGALSLRSRLGGAPTPTAPESLADIIDRKALRSAKRYFPTTYAGDCAVFIGMDSYYYAGLSAASDPRLVWCKLARGKNEVRRIPGDHLTMLREPNVHEFAKQLKPFLQ